MIDHMGKIDLPFLSVERTRHGREVHYVRKHGRRTRLPSPDDPAFMDCYRAALEGAPAPRKIAGVKPGTLGWLILAYLESQTYARLANSTRDARRRILDGIRERSGAATIGAVTQQAVVRGRDKRVYASILSRWPRSHGLQGGGQMRRALIISAIIALIVFTLDRFSVAI